MCVSSSEANAAPANASFARGLGRVPLSLHCRLRGRPSGAARGVRTTAPEAGSGPAGVAGAGPGAAGRRGELRPSDLPTFPPDGRLPPAGRVHAYLLCSGAARLPCRPGGRTDGAGGRPSPRPAQPAQQRPGPSGHVTQLPGQSPHPGSRLPPPLRRRHHPEVLPTAPLTVQARCAVPPGPQAARTPPPARGGRLHSRDPHLLVRRGVPHGSAHVPVPLPHRLLSAGTCRRRRQGGGRGARGGAAQLGVPSAARAGEREPAQPSPARPGAPGPASRPPSHRAPTLAGVTAPPPRERWRIPWPKLRPRQGLRGPEMMATTIFVCFYHQPASLEGGNGAPEGNAWRNVGRECCGCC